MMLQSPQNIFIFTCRMSKFIQKYNGAFRAGFMLVVVYCMHLLTFHTLLSNPNDFLTASSFDQYKAKPDLLSNCLLLLAKEQLAKHEAVAVDNFVGDHPHVVSLSTLTIPLVSIIRKVQCLSDLRYKRYQLLSVLRI